MATSPDCPPPQRETSPCMCLGEGFLSGVLGVVPPVGPFSEFGMSKQIWPITRQVAGVVQGEVDILVELK